MYRLLLIVSLFWEASVLGQQIEYPDLAAPTAEAVRGMSFTTLMQGYAEGVTLLGSQHYGSVKDVLESHSHRNILEQAVGDHLYILAWDAARGALVVTADGVALPVTSGADAHGRPSVSAAGVTAFVDVYEGKILLSFVVAGEQSWYQGDVPAEGDQATGPLLAPFALRCNCGSSHSAGSCDEMAGDCRIHANCATTDYPHATCWYEEDPPKPAPPPQPADPGCGDGIAGPILWGATGMTFLFVSANWSKRRPQRR